MKTPFISVIIAVYNGEEFIPGCIKSLLKMDYSSDKFEIIVVDNNSTDGTADLVKKYPVRYVFEEIKGPSAARNAGARVALGSIFAFIDVDVIVEKNWLSEMEKIFTDKNIDAVMGRCAGINRSVWAELSQRYYDLLLAQKMSERDNVTKIASGNFAIKSTVFFESQGFDNTFLCSEDVEFGLRLYNRKYNTVFSPEVKINHINSCELKTIINARREQSFYDYKITRFYDEETNKKHFPSLFRQRYKFIFFNNERIEKPILLTLNWILPISIGMSILSLKFILLFTGKNRIYPAFLFSLGLATYHGKILSRSVERGYISMKSCYKADNFKRPVIA